MTDKMSRGLSVKVDVDVSEALTGLKALQREAKKATQEIREFARTLDENERLVIPILSAFSTDDLIMALHARCGVSVVRDEALGVVIRVAPGAVSE